MRWLISTTNKAADECYMGRQFDYDLSNDYAQGRAPDAARKFRARQQRGHHKPKPA